MKIHPRLGLARPEQEDPKRCSRCTRFIPEGEAPLMIFERARSGRRVYLYHENPKCEGQAWAFLAEQRRMLQ